VNKSLEEDELSPDDKCALLCAFLKYLKIESEPVWVCSDNSTYGPMPNFPSIRQFDYTLTYIPSKDLYLDPVDPGGELGILDGSLSDRLMCRPMADSNHISTTPEFDEFSARQIKLNVTLTDENDLRGKGTVVFNNQAALDARRVYKFEGEEDNKSRINDILFRDYDDAVISYSIVPDSLLKPNQFQLDFEIEILDFIEDDQPEFELFFYPGPTITKIETDDNPPRKYPFYFQTKYLSVYDIEWNLGDRYIPLKTDSLSLETKKGLLSYQLLAEYDESANRLSVRRQYRRPQKMFRPNFVRAFENFRRNVRKCDLSDIIVVQK
jgi:hypothetical protein